MALATYGSSALAREEQRRIHERLKADGLCYHGPGDEEE